MESLMKMFMVLLGSFITAIGIIIFIKSGWGVDPISVLLQGLETRTNLRFGTLSSLFNAVIIAFVFFIDRKKVGWGSLINALSVGIFINLMIDMPVFKAFHPEGAFGLFFAAAAAIIMGVGLGTYVHANYGLGALEGLMVLVNERTSLSLKLIRIIIDATLVSSGFLLGGSVGIGTIAGVLLIGPSIEKTLNVYTSLSGKRI
ncbi:YczE/YyaS/YitT family protein [Bacillus sp. 1P06AnD]|uniref:YczE/YyaS/YitT family protein n=1 Tax=Bacillus sp. 1P06AnD TaxID=3132208 RepID=UPI00399F30FF